MNAALMIDSVIESFERQRSHNRGTSLSDFLPSENSAEFNIILTELVRVDLEFSWEEGKPNRLEEYLDSYPQLKDDPSSLGAVAFEEYRQRQRAGETPSAAEYHRRYRIDTRQWPVSMPPDDAIHDTPLAGEDQPTLRRTPTQPVAGSEISSQLSYLLDGTAQKLPHVGSHFLDFILEAELGQGAFGKVYLARQISLAKRQVALKITARKQHEPQTLARLRHTNIMPIYSVHNAGSCQAICMPFLGRTTLADILLALRQEARMPVSGLWWSLLIEGNEAAALASQWKQSSYGEVALCLAEKMVAGLAHAHAAGIIHRDIKPANILFSQDGEPLLLDFNLAIILDNGGALAEMAGTLPYLAPEQLESLVKGQGTTGSKAADIYAMGLIFYELLTGKPAYSGIKRDSLLSYLADLAKQRRVPAGLVRTISPALAAILARCLAVSPEDRYADAQELLEDLQRQRRNQVLRYAPDRSLAERWSKWNRRHPKFLRYGLILGVALLLVAGGVTYSQYRESEQRLNSRTQFTRSVKDLQRAERLATTIWPTELAEAEALVKEFISKTLGINLATPATLLNAAGVRYLTEQDQQRLPALTANALLLQAHIYRLQEHRAKTAQEKEKLRQQSLHANELAQPWCQAAGFASVCSWQRKLLLNESWADDWKALIQSPRDALPAKQLAGIAHTLLAQQHWSEAAALARQVIDREPGWSGGWYLYGEVHARGGQLLQALHGFDTALALEPDVAVALHFRGQLRMQLGDEEGALADFDKALALGARPALVLADRALVFLNKQKPKEALDALDQALAADDTQVRLYFQRARAKALLGDKKGAAEDRRLGLAVTPLNELDFVTRGIARRDVGDWKGALDEFKKAEEVAPAYLPALENQSEILGEQLQKPAEALAVLNRAIERIPESTLLYASRAVYHARLGHRADALSDVNSALKHDAMPKPLTLYQIGCVYALTSKSHPPDLFQAIAYLSIALEQHFGKEYLAIDTDLNPIRSRPEFQELIKRYPK
ncbi:MAG TPA: protein kinase [Gemmatales bacterium]|nr:protein kinase [Gemmatales bacterium]